MKTGLFFSIVIPTYNRASNLKIALKHILKQNFKNFEVVVSDNASTDKTEEIVRSLSDKRIKYFRNKTNIDVMPNVRKSITLAKGKYVFLHGDDDLLINESALSMLHKIISETKVGYLRVNYLSLSPDGKHIFDFRASKNYIKDIMLKKTEDNLKIIEFLLKSDPSFITGVIFKNDLPSTVKVLDSQLYSWFPIIFYSSKKYGAYYVNTPYILAGWSQWRMREDDFNPLYSIRNGKLTSENYFHFVEKHLKRNEYKKFLREQLQSVYVNRFLIIKLFTGNKNLKLLTERLRTLEPTVNRNLFFNLHLILALIIPRFVLVHIKNVYLAIYIKRANKDSKYNVKYLLSNNF